MKRLVPVLILAGTLALFLPSIANAALNDDIGRFTRDTLTVLISVAGLASAIFLIRGGYIYITSTGKPEALFEAKRSIRQALLGLIIVIGAGIFSSLLFSSFNQPHTQEIGPPISLVPIEADEDEGSLGGVITAAITSFLKNIVQSATKPVIDGIIHFLTTTPMLSTNSVVFNFWLIMLGITNSLFALVIALLGFQVMGASAFGFGDVSLKQLLPRIGLAFIMANTSIFVIDWVIKLCHALVRAIIDSTGGIGGAWILNSLSAEAIVPGTSLLITLIFMTIFICLAIILLLFYISRLVLLAFGAVIAPLLCLVWLMPKMSDFAEGMARSYVVIIFSIFIHVVIIQLASAFLTIPNQVGTNPIISILIGIATLSIMLKSTAITAQLALSSQASSTWKRYGEKALNVASSGYSRIRRGNKLVY